MLRFYTNVKDHAMETIILALIAAAAMVMAFYLWMRLRVLQAGYDMKQALLQELELTADNSAQTLEAARDEAAVFKQEAALAKQEGTQLRTQMQELRQDREKFMEHAKAAAFETGQQISTRLMEDHKREREHAQKQIEQMTKHTSESLMKEQKDLAQMIGKIQHESQDTAGKMNILVRAMKNPIGAGAEAEIGFDNLLGALGLRAGQDYDLQFHMASEEGSFRPDALIYLPGEQVMVVDCKASQHIYALFEAEGSDAYEATFNKLCATMRTHVKQLASKQYITQLKKHLLAAEKTASRLIQVMYVPNEEVISRLRKHDPEFMELAIRHEIMLAGPDTLPSLFMLAKNVITEARQTQNQQKILLLTQELISDVITAVSYAGDMSKAFQRSGSAFDKFITSLNARAIPKMRRLKNMGLAPAGNKEIPVSLGTFKVLTDSQPVIEGEVETEEMPALQLQTSAKNNAA
jgi:DNA recombination protein RmuC